MDERLVDLRSTKNPKARIKIMKGHFATSNSHINTYIDMSTVKVRHNNCRETAKVLADEYVHTTLVDTIVCLEETDTIGTFMAEQLADVSRHSLSHGNNISIVSPEYHQNGQIFWLQRDIAALPTDGRPISQSTDLNRLYGVRRPLYAAFADQIIENNGTVSDAAEKILTHMGVTL